MLDERCRAYDDARDAEAALHTTLEHEGFTDDAPGLFWKAVERHDLVPIHLLRLAKARQRRTAVDHHQTAAARPLRGTAVLGRHHATLLAENLEQVHPGFVCRFGGFSVQGEPDARHAG